MTGNPETEAVAGALRFGIGLLVRRLRQLHPDGGLSMSESSALTVLDREGPATCSVLAKRERITPQSMGVTLTALESRGLVERHADPSDGRRAVMSLTPAGRDMVLRRRDATNEMIARSLATDFTADELGQLRSAATLIERLARAL